MSRHVLKYVGGDDHNDDIDYHHRAKTMTEGGGRGSLVLAQEGKLVENREEKKMPRERRSGRTELRKWIKLCSIWLIHLTKWVSTRRKSSGCSCFTGDCRCTTRNCKELFFFHQFSECLELSRCVSVCAHVLIVYREINPIIFSCRKTLHLVIWRAECASTQLWRRR